MADFEPDEIGNWSEVKLDILREYAAAYSKILSAQSKPKFDHVYIDGFAGAGLHRSRERGDLIKGSPIIALEIEPPFKEYHFVDLNRSKAEFLMKSIEGSPTAQVYHGDCNDILLQRVFPRVRYEDFRRGLCVLDPYGLNLKWEVMKTAGQMKSIDMFLDFMVMDMNRNVLWKDPKKVSPGQAARLNLFWGDKSWDQVAYVKQETLFGSEEQKTTNKDIVQAFRERLKKLAGFKYVPEPIPMKNKSGATIYYLFFASQKPVAADIVTSIFTKYRNRG
ncbi:MAG: three-Cys-motif partner protein TcmP [Tepidisphaeraceae bacterium]|jgi:three-Cys-motif partner protein